MSLEIEQPIALPRLASGKRLRLTIHGQLNSITRRWTFTVHYHDNPRKTIPGRLGTDTFDRAEALHAIVSKWTATAAEHYGLGNWRFELDSASHDTMTFDWIVGGV